MTVPAAPLGLGRDSQHDPHPARGSARKWVSCRSFVIDNLSCCSVFSQNDRQTACRSRMTDNR